MNFLSSTDLAELLQEEHLAHCLIMLARGGGADSRKPPPLPELISYKCSICGKEFPSHQALGGHKSSHRKPGVVGESRPVPVSSASSGGSGGASSSGGRHKCNICYRVFGTGQALGGHKRRHYLEGSSASSGTRWFDLNLPASTELGEESWMDEGEEEVQSPLPCKKKRVLSA